MNDIVSDITKVLKVKGEHEKGLVECLQKIRKWEKFKKDYETLHERLKTLPDKRAYNIMVPFGSHAFMPGMHIQTNDVMVLLGDNWFAEVSAKQACGIAQRRIKQCDKMLDDLNKEKKLFEDWLGFIADVEEEQDLVEIKEEYDPEKEKLWREQHAKNVRAYRQKMMEEKKAASEKEAGSSSDEFDLLNKLEAEEEEEEDLSESEDLSSESEDDLDDEAEDDDSKNGNSSAREENVTETLSAESKELDRSSAVEDSSKAELINHSDNDHAAADKHVRWIDLSEAKSKKITFTHSTYKPPPQKKKNRKRRNSSNSDLEEEDSPVPLINSPSDIYKCFSYSMQHSKPKSILKPMNSGSASDSSVSSSVDSRDSIVNLEPVVLSNHKDSKVQEDTSSPESSTEKAFTGEVQEHLGNGDVPKLVKSEKRPKSLFKSSRHIPRR